MLLITPGNDALELAFSTESAAELAEVDIVSPAFLETPEYKQRANEGYYALIVYDQCQPPALPQADTLFVGRLPPGDSWKWSDLVDAPQIIDVDTAHPLMQLIDLGDVKFAEGRVLTVPQGGTVLVDSHAGPLFAIAPRRLRRCGFGRRHRRSRRRGAAFCQHRLALAPELSGVRDERAARFRRR